MAFEPTIPASERAKTVHVLDRLATVTGVNCISAMKFGLPQRQIKGDKSSESNILDKNLLCVMG
jgi:hypothetical protein